MAFTVPIFTKLTPLLRIFTQLGQEACKWRLDIHFRPRVRCHCHWDDFHKLVLARQLIFSNFLTEFHKSPTTVQSVILRPRQTVRRGLHLWRSYYYFVRNVQLLFSEKKSSRQTAILCTTFDFKQSWTCRSLDHTPEQERLLLASPPYNRVEEDAVCARRFTGFVCCLMRSPHDLELQWEASARFCECVIVCVCVCV